MCGITGFCSFQRDFLCDESRNSEVLTRMRESLSRRGNDEWGEYLDEHCALGHTRLSIIDLKTGRQPIEKTINEKKASIVYNGELYNMAELKSDLLNKGYRFVTKTDAEIVLTGFTHYGADFVHKMNGIFAFVIWDGERMHMFRDRLGIKPLFYTIRDDTIIFGSEMKALFKYPGIEAVLNKEGLCEIFGLGPARTAGVGVFESINDIMPGHYCIYDRDGFHTHKYWDVISREHTDSYEKTLEKTLFLIQDAVKRQMVSDVPICSFLSGGVDSSIVTAIAAKELQKQGMKLNTFSFDFTGNDQFFESNAFQPDRDRPWVDKMVSEFKTNHRYLECGNEEMANLLYEAVDAKDLPGMADVDSSLLYFCSKVKEYNKVALTGECSDEIFGGYPWFHSREAFENDAFPWSNMVSRKALLSDELLAEIDIDAYADKRYRETIGLTPRLDGESAEENRRREIAYLNLKWFMLTLIDRMDRTSMYSGLEARVPFADHRIIEYVWNVPWDIKCRGGVVKHLLRESAKGLLPTDVLFRKKSPYPKSYNPAYEELLKYRLTEVMEDPASPILRLVDREKMTAFISGKLDRVAPWYGQLMAGPQMLAYMLQVNYWLGKYGVRLRT